MTNSKLTARWGLLLACTLSNAAYAQTEPAEATEGATPGSNEAPSSESPPVDAPAATTEPSPAPVVVTPAVVAAEEVADEPATSSAASSPAASDTDATQAAAEEQLSTEDAALRTMSTAAGSMVPSFAFWQGDEGFIKPVLQMSAMLVGYVPHSDVSDSLAYRVSTLALARFGLEGELFGFLTFRSVFERNIGYSLARNGPVGTSVWEGTASLQARENYIRLSQWGLSVTGGIFRDPATVDYISVNTLDAFGMDPYVRDPLLLSGFSQGQGAMLRYNWRWLTAGFSFTGGNPLTSSLAFSFGGDVSSLGTLYTAPLRALSNGIPGSDIQMYVMTPSLTFEHDRFDIKVAGQFYRIDADVTSDTDQELKGYNLRATARGNVWPHHLQVYGTFAYRSNEQLAVPDLTMFKGDYQGIVVGAGSDFTWGNFGLGASYYWIQSTTDDQNPDAVDDVLTNHYLNVGMTYWLRPPFVSVGLRYSRSMASYNDESASTIRLKASDSIILSMRLLI